MFVRALDLQANNANIYNNLGVALLEQKKIRRGDQIPEPGA